MGKYCIKAKRYIECRSVEAALTTLVAGLDHGEDKCAYYLLRILLEHTTPTFTEDEAISIFKDRYPYIRNLAEDGDAEAMLIVAEAIRYGFAEDDEPYMFWLTRASEQGYDEATLLLCELERNEEIDALPPPKSDREGNIPYDATLSLVCSAGAGASSTDELASECVLIAEPDVTLLEELGILDDLKRREANGRV